MINPMSTRPFIATVLALALLSSAWAQTAKEQSAVTVAGAEPEQSTATRDRDTLSVDFPEEDIRTILRNVADLFELNLVVPDTLTGRSSIKLRDVTWRQIFQVVLAPAGYTFIEEGNIVKVLSQDLLAVEPVSTEVFILNNAKAVDIRPTIEGLVDAAAGGRILVDARSNALVITERPTRMMRVRSIIEQLDKATEQVMIESRFVEVSDSDIRNLGVNWASLQGTTLSARGLTQNFARGRGQSSTSGISSNNGTTTGSTVATTTINTGGTTTSSISTNTGTLLTFDPTTGIPTVTPIPNPGAVNSLSTTSQPSTQTNVTNSSTVDSISILNNLVSLTNTADTSRLTSAVFSAADFNIVLSALMTQSDTKVVSNPTIVTLNNTEASINIGSEFPIPSYTYNSERGTFEVSGFQYKPIGVLLRVTPQVNAQGTIRLSLEPEISSSNRETSFGGAGGASIPIIDTRKVKTQVSLKDGYTAGIGGLLSTSRNNGSTKVPVLGSVPLLGRLFSSKSVNERTTNLLIFITAKTVNPDGASPSDVFSAAALNAVEQTAVQVPSR
jgi:type II secretory pathway component GspD/PulD (secretin)